MGKESLPCSPGLHFVPWAQITTEHSVTWGPGSGLLYGPACFSPILRVQASIILSQGETVSH